MLKIRRPLGRLVFNMGIAIPGKTVFLIETAPRLSILADWYKCTADTFNLEWLSVHLIFDIVSISTIDVCEKLHLRYIQKFLSRNL